MPLSVFQFSYDEHRWDVDGEDAVRDALLKAAAEQPRVLVEGVDRAKAKGYCDEGVETLDDLLRLISATMVEDWNMPVEAVKIPLDRLDEMLRRDGSSIVGTASTHPSAGTSPSTLATTSTATTSAEKSPAADLALGRAAFSRYCGECHDGRLPTAKPKALAIFDLTDARWIAKLCGHRELSRTVRASLELLAPGRVADEEIDDAMGMIAHLIQQGRPTWQTHMKVISTVFWFWSTRFTQQSRGR